MPKSDAQENQPPAGYPTADLPAQKKSFSRTKKKGDRGFIEGCLFALCCCWLCETCF
ncbi:hypothetical protein QUC31_010663 [Theobroma cacao]|uniref:Cysteine-rich and transmembrane domain-containing protein A n=1 Tax=Theobroma cacao TaxID=3641 RepID=A0AB32V357_THECC|nr:PREDICTED: cysteine-rich and transmembrane domain-containing protein A [Theobroma cacao]